MDFLTCITEGMTWLRLALIVAVFAALFIPFDIWMNRKSDRLARQKGGAQMIDNYELIKMVRGSDHRE